MSRKLIKVRYCFNDEEKKTILVEVGSTVRDFLKLAKEQESNPDICAAYIKGRKLDFDDLIQNHVKDKNDIVIISDDPSKTAEDFIDIDFTEPGKAADINDTMNQSKRDVFSLPSSIFRQKNTFKIYTTATQQSFFKGDDITIMNSDTFEIITEKVKELIISFNNPDIPENFLIHIFLPGGVPFLSGNIKDYFDSIEVTHNVLYVIITKEIDSDFLNEEVNEPCNCSKKYEDILSPLFESTESGLTQISSFLGYIYHHGIYAEHIFRILAKMTRFAPLITNYYRLLENAPLTNLNIIAITGPLHVAFQSLIPSVKSEELFEFTLKIFTSIGLLSDVEYLHIHTVDLEEKKVNENDKNLIEYLKKTNQQNHVVIWECDTAFPNFTGFEIMQIEFDNINDIFKAVTTFKPIPPLSLHYVYYPSFIAADADNKKVMLFLREVPNKKKFIQYIDPKVGKVQIENIEKLAKNLNFGNKVEDAIDLVDSEQIQQINYICFDQSVSMKFRLIGGVPHHGEGTRAEISSDFLRALIEQSYKFRVSSLYGLISFNSKVEVLQELTPMSSDFIEKLKKIKPHDQTHLWDAIKLAKDRIVELLTPSKDEEDEDEDEIAPFPNAQCRIIVITDGEDNKSETDPVLLVNELINHNIIVDTILVSLLDRTNKCCAISKLTGGLCFRPASKEEGLEIFEQEAFLNVTTRHLNGPLYGNKEITKEMFEKVTKTFDSFDKSAENQEIINAKSDFPLSTPLFMCYQYQSKDPETIRKKRAILELNIIGHHPSKDYKVFSSHANPIEWRIFIKGQNGTPFEGKWLNVFMTLPTEYPFNPPKFRFLTVPFHPNISSEGVVAFSMLDVNYSSSVKISEIIDGIIKLLKVPEKNYPINISAMNLYLNDEDEFNNKQNEAETGADDFNEFINCKVYDEIPDDVEIPEDTRDSLYMTNATNTVFPGRVLGKSESSDDGDDDDDEDNKKEDDDDDDDNKKEDDDDDEDD